jgi:hypothetical protein
MADYLGEFRLAAVYDPKPIRTGSEIDDTVLDCNLPYGRQAIKRTDKLGPQRIFRNTIYSQLVGGANIQIIALDADTAPGFSSVTFQPHRRAEHITRKERRLSCTFGVRGAPCK